MRDKFHFINSSAATNLAENSFHIYSSIGLFDKILYWLSTLIDVQIYHFLDNKI